jgi:hypothetical protein
MTYGISFEGINVAPQEVKEKVYSCNCRNVFQCPHPSFMIDVDDIPIELIDNGAIKIIRGSAISYGSCLVRIPGTAGTLSRYL